MSPRHLLLALLLVTVWGVNFVAIRWGVDEVPPLLLGALRYAFAALPAVFFIRPPRALLTVIIGYGMLIGVMQFGLLFAAIKLGMPAGLASLVMQLQVFFTIGLAVLVLGERPPRAVQLLGALAAFAGIGAIGAEHFEDAALIPLLMTIAAAFFWGAGNIIAKRAGNVDMLSFVVWSSLVPPGPLFLASLLIEGPQAVPVAIANVSWVGIGSLLFIAYASTVFGYGAFNYLLSRYPTGAVAPFTLLVPITGMGSAGLVLGERISGLEIAGSLLVFIGLAVNVFGPRLLDRARRKPQ